MTDLAVGRDATVMFESAHARLELATKILATLPKFDVEEIEKKGYDFGRKETCPTPSQSPLYETIRKRVLEEVLKPRGMATGAKSARGVPWWHFGAVIVTWLATAAWFVCRPSVLSGLVLGFALCWIGTGVQHTANHGGAAKNTTLEYLLGLLDDLGPGGSSVVWRYHHQVAHHAYCNDIELDPDAFSSFPLIRLDSSQKWQPYHRFQWIYAHFLFALMWPSNQIQDLKILLMPSPDFYGVTFKGTGRAEIALALFLKFLHVCWIIVLPLQIHGFHNMVVPWIAAFGFGGWFLAAMFIVSHNVDEVKYSNDITAKGDWAKQQIETSTSWGGTVGSFMSGGLSMQIKHHLFPCMAHHLYVDVQKIVQDECAKNGVKYAAYPTLFHNLVDHVKFLHQMGKPPETASVDNGKTTPLLKEEKNLVK